MARARRLALLVFCLFTVAAPAAHAAGSGLAAASVYLPDSQTQPPLGFRTNAIQARQVAERQPELREAQREHQPERRPPDSLPQLVPWGSRHLVGA